MGLTDPLRPDIRDAVAQCHSAGIRVIMITGDYPTTARVIATQAGLPDGEVLTGSELAALDEAALRERLRNVHTCARITPAQKLRLVQALQASGEAVAMTGDGINDAPSLKQADIGIAMGSGSDVAKDVAELVLLDNNYHTIIAAIEEGRRTMENVRKVIVYLFSSVLDELILIGGVS